MWVSNLSPEEMTNVLEPIFVQLGCGHCLDQNTFRNWSWWVHPMGSHGITQWEDHPRDWQSLQLDGGVKDATAWGFRSGKGLRLLLRSLRTSLTDHSGFAKKSLRSSFCSTYPRVFPQRFPRFLVHKGRCWWSQWTAPRQRSPMVNPLEGISPEPRCSQDWSGFWWNWGHPVRKKGWDSMGARG